MNAATKNIATKKLLYSVFLQFPGPEMFPSKHDGHMVRSNVALLVPGRVLFRLKKILVFKNTSALKILLEVLGLLGSFPLPGSSLL